MKNNYLVFSVDFSGVSERIFNEISAQNVELDIIPMPKMWSIYLWSFISTFCFSYKKWVQKAETKYNQLHKTPWAFDRKSRWCARVLKRRSSSRYQGIIQVSGTFDCLRYFKTDKPFYILTDYTMSLAQQKQDALVKPLLPLGEKALNAWLEREEKVYKAAKRIMVPSQYIKNALYNDYSVSKSCITVVGYGVNFDLKEPKAKSWQVKKKRTLLFVGKRFEQKGGDVILKALDILNKDDDFAELVIVGPRSNPCPNRDDVSYLGRIYDRQELLDVYQQADVFVIHSYYEAFGLVLLEAMINGLPCIASDIDAMPDILADGRGFVVPLQDAKSLAQKIRSLVVDQDLYESISKKGVNAVVEYYNWPAVSRRFLAAL